MRNSVFFVLFLIFVSIFTPCFVYSEESVPATYAKKSFYGISTIDQFSKCLDKGKKTFEETEDNGFIIHIVNKDALTHQTNKVSILLMPISSPADRQVVMINQVYISKFCAKPPNDCYVINRMVMNESKELPALGIGAILDKFLAWQKVTSPNSKIKKNKSDEKYSFNFETMARKQNALKIFQSCREIQKKNGFCTGNDVVAVVRQMGLKLTPEVPEEKRDIANVKDDEVSAVSANKAAYRNYVMRVGNELCFLADISGWRSMGFTVDPKDKTKPVNLYGTDLAIKFFIPDEIFESFENSFGN